MCSILLASFWAGSRWDRQLKTTRDCISGLIVVTEITSLTLGVETDSTIVRKRSKIFSLAVISRVSINNSPRYFSCFFLFYSLRYSDNNFILYIINISGSTRSLAYENGYSRRHAYSTYNVKPMSSLQNFFSVCQVEHLHLQNRMPNFFIQCTESWRICYIQGICFARTNFAHMMKISNFLPTNNSIISENTIKMSRFLTKIIMWEYAHGWFTRRFSNLNEESFKAHHFSIVEWIPHPLQSQQKSS